MLYYMFIC